MTVNTEALNHSRWPIPVLGFAAFSGTGKTTLLCQLIPLLRASGLRLGLIKHSHHTFEVDHPGKDSFVLRAAGASQIVIASAQRSVALIQYPKDREPGLADFLGQISDDSLDLLLVEGYKRADIPKIELHRPSLGQPLLAVSDPAIIAVASDETVTVSVPVLDLNAPLQIAEFIIDRLMPTRDSAGR